MIEEHNEWSDELVLKRANDLNTEYDVSNPFSNPVIDNYCSENEAKVYLTREDIKELGFLRSNPDRAIYRHKDKPKLVLVKDIIKDYGIKDQAVEVIRIVIWNMPDTNNVILYNSQRPNKEDIQQVINNYAG